MTYRVFHRVTEDARILPPATFFERATALSIDLTFLFGILGLVGSLVRTDDFWSGNLLKSSLTAGVVIFYSILPTAQNGQTIGKRIMRIRVVSTRQSDGKVHLGAAIRRETVSKLGSALFFGLGFVAALFSNENLTWHDSTNGTRVVSQKARRKAR